MILLASDCSNLYFIHQFFVDRVLGTKRRTGHDVGQELAPIILVPNQTAMIICFGNIFLPRAIVVSLPIGATSIRYTLLKFAIFSICIDDFP